MIKGNKGEWSEFYAFLKILTDKKLFAADENLELLKDKFYLVLRVIREEAKNGKKTYDVSEKEGFITVNDADGSQLGVIDEGKIKASVLEIFNQMKSSTDTTFEISIAEDAMKDLFCTQIKAANNKKSDIFAVVHDRISPTYPTLGFSIKSMLGGASTLLNASGATNLVFNVDGYQGLDDEINSIEGKSKVRDRITKIQKAGGKVIFEDVENVKFKKNLRKIDYILPDILAEIAKAFFEGKGSRIPDLVEAICKNEELNQKYGMDKGDYEYKIKSFLSAVALGMSPTDEWDGLTEAHGGYIVVKENGELACYHLYNRDEFQAYLYQNTKLETPSTTRHKYASLYDEDGSKKIKLNLQIRFLK